MGLFDRNKRKKQKKQKAAQSVADVDRTVTLHDENGKELQFELWDLITLDGHQYCVLLPLFNDDDSVCILEVVDVPDSDEEAYISVDSEETLNAVFALFKERFEKRYGSE